MYKILNPGGVGKYCLLFLLIFNLYGCCTFCDKPPIVVEEPVYLTIQKIKKPKAKPHLVLDGCKPITEAENFRKLAYNIIEDKKHIKNLEDTIDYYEKEIDRIDDLLETKNSGEKDLDNKESEELDTENSDQDSHKK